jgi:hypothetical protein
MSFETFNLIENISGSTDGVVLYTDKTRGAGYYLNNDGVHTFTIETINFVGSVTIQATLELYPGKDDWFDVTIQGFVNADTLRSFNITGKFVFIRAAYRITVGEIALVCYNY